MSQLRRRVSSIPARLPRVVRARPSTLAFVLAALGCGHSSTPQERWFAERGRQSPTWHTCLRMAVELRDACGDDATCATQVTRDLSRSCYAGRYHQEASHSKPSDEVRGERLSPCFWDAEPKQAASPVEYARRTCSGVVAARLQPACVAELREVIERVCTEGATDLTGVGP
jgi:hypothetical protein